MQSRDAIAHAVDCDRVVPTLPVCRCCLQILKSMAMKKIPRLSFWPGASITVIVFVVPAVRLFQASFRMAKEPLLQRAQLTQRHRFGLCFIFIMLRRHRGYILMKKKDVLMSILQVTVIGEKLS